MNEDRESRIERIRERAHRIWENEGCPEGRDTEHWEQAKSEIENEDRGREDSGEIPMPSGAAAGGGQGVSSGLQPGSSALAGGPGSSVGSLGTGGGSTADRATGAARRRRGTGSGEDKSGS